MEHARLRKPSVSQGEDTLPGDRAFLAAAAKCLPPMPNRSFPEYAETVEVPRYRIVVEVALHDRFEPIAGQSTVLVVLDDRSKQAAAMHVCEQAWRFCQESGISGFRLRFDENIVSDWKALKTHLDAFNPPCVGLCEADSRYEDLIQAADFVAGAMKLKIDLGLGERDPN